MARLDFKKGAISRFKPVDQLSLAQAREEVRALREAINYHDRLYYVENRPVISDALYDKIFKRLEELEQHFPALRKATSPTQKVSGRAQINRQAVVHAAPMLSLHAAADAAELARFHQLAQRANGNRPIRYVLEPKFDGVSVELVYRDGLFQRAATRGDGNSGDDISHLLMKCSGLPQQLRQAGKLPAVLAVRGEALLTKQEFLEINRRRVIENLEPFANPRNATAGILHRLVPEADEVPLKVVVYEILMTETPKPATQYDVWQQLGKWGFTNSQPCQLATCLEEISQFHQQLEDTRDRLTFEIDGIVIKIDDLSTVEKLGTRHRSPRGALAWKFAARQEITTLEDIVVQVGRSGKLTPVALLSPVDVGGVTVSRATLHNEQEIHRKDIRRGDQVRIKRAGDVIPEVISRIDVPGQRRGEMFHMPTSCPACGALVVHQEANHCCPAGINCPGQLVGCLTHFASREALDIQGLGINTARQLVELGLVHDVSDIFRLDVQALKSLTGFGIGSATKLHASIQNAKRPTVDRFLYALAIRHVGQRTARTLARRFPSFPSLCQATAGELIAAVGPVAGKAVCQFFESVANKRILRRLEESGLRVQDTPATTSKTECEGRTFVFTGTLDNYKRDTAVDAIEVRGGHAASSVSSHTDYVIAGRNPGTKLADAQRLGIPVLDESQFRQLLRS